MDVRLLNFYNLELQHLREMGAEFGREFPKIAARLALDRDAKEACPDPFVERLLEGFAFLTARVHLKLDAEFPRFTQSILETVYPHYLAPTPSMAVVRFEPDPEGVPPDAGFTIARGSALKSEAIGEGRTACEYRTAQAVELWPIQLTEAQYYTRDLGQLYLPRGTPARAAIRLRLKTAHGLPFREVKLDRLPFFIRGADDVPVSIMEQIFARGRGVIVQSASANQEKPRTFLPASSIRRVGFREDEALFPNGPRGFQGYRFLHEYFALPQRYLFFEIGGLRAGLEAAEEDEVELLILLSDQETRLEGRVEASSFELFCTPVINLFPLRTDRIQLTDRFSEFQVVADKTRPLDFEIFSVEKVTGFGSGPADEQTFRPFYTARDSDEERGAFFSVNRVPRVLTGKERKLGSFSAYAGSEVYLSLVDAACAPYPPSLDQLGVEALCTNRHLPIQMTPGSGPTDFSMQMHAPVRAIRCLSGPTQPRPPFAMGSRSWRIISHLALNYLSLLDAPEGRGAEALRDFLGLYADPNDAFARKQTEGLRSAVSRPVVRRVETPGPIAFARGLEVTLLFDESLFEGTGIFLLGSVLDQFFARYVSLNSFTETVIKTQQRGEIIRWPAQIGRRQLV